MENIDGSINSEKNDSEQNDSEKKQSEEQCESEKKETSIYDAETESDESSEELSVLFQGIKLNKPVQGWRLLRHIPFVIEAYFQRGSRSSEKVKILHDFLKIDFKRTFSGKDYKIITEYNVDSCNASGKKRCDIVIFRRDKLFAIFPVKFIMSNYKQNKNNNWETLTGEMSHLKWCNESVHIVPVNIIFNKVPYLMSSGIIKSWEDITYDNSWKIMESLIEKKLASDTMSYIIDVRHTCKIGERYNTCPKILGYNKDTPFKIIQLK